MNATAASACSMWLGRRQPISTRSIPAEEKSMQEPVSPVIGRCVPRFFRARRVDANRHRENRCHDVPAKRLTEHRLRLASVARWGCASRLLHFVFFGFLRARFDELLGRAATFVILVLAARLFDLMPGSPMHGVSRERGIASFFGPIQLRIGDRGWFSWTGRNR